jgi:hypothetical protein
MNPIKMEQSRGRRKSVHSEKSGKWERQYRSYPAFISRLYFAPGHHLAFKRGLLPSCLPRFQKGIAVRRQWGGAMRHTARYHDFDEHTDPTAAMAAAITNVLGEGKRSSALPERDTGAARIDQLIRSGARIDAAFALIALELPQWQLRRIAYDGGEWHCALSRAREIADWLDQSAEGRHADLALAILDAVVEAQRIAVASRQPSSPPQPVNATYVLLCCDNFS